PHRRLVRLLRWVGPGLGTAARVRAARHLVDVRQPAQFAAARADVRSPACLPGAALPARSARFHRAHPERVCRSELAPMTVALPLLQGHAADAVVAWRAGHAVGVDEFCRDVRRLAAELPERRYVFNRCADRYRFAVGFAAALVRRQVSLLPPNETPDLLGRLLARYPDVYCLSDSPGAPVGLDT